MRRHQLIAAASAGLIAAVIAGAVAYATIPGDGNVYTACMLKNVGTVRLIDPSLPSSNLMSHCTSLETHVSWNQKGLPGVAGPAGGAGKDGIDGTPGVDGKDGEPGIAGPKGDQGDPGLRFRGTWNQFVDYLSGNVVQHGGSSWVATEFACCGAEPGVSDKWSLLATAGASGWEIRKGEAIEVPSIIATVTTSVACPAGKRAIAGGYSASDNVDVTLSMPSMSGDAWYGAATGMGQSTHNGVFTLYVICENVTP